MSWQKMIEELGLLDIWRCLHPRDRDFTFMSFVHGTYLRIYFFAISKKDSYRARESKIGSITISDYARVTLSMSLGSDETFKYWRINVSLLTDSNVCQEIKSNLDECFTLNDKDNINPSILWDLAKVENYLYIFKN